MLNSTLWDRTDRLCSDVTMDGSSVEHHVHDGKLQAFCGQVATGRNGSGPDRRAALQQLILPFERKVRIGHKQPFF